MQEFLALYKNIENQEISSGNKIIGYVNIDNNPDDGLSGFLPCLGNYKDINQIIIRKIVISSRRVM